MIVVNMSVSAIESRTIPSSEAGLTSVNSANRLIRASVAIQAGLNRLATLGSKLRAGLSSVLSGPTIYPSSPLRPEESPSPQDKTDIENGDLKTLRIPPRWAFFALTGTGLLAKACVPTPQEENIPAIVEKAKPGALAPGIGGAEPLPTFPPGHPREKENPGIDEVNRKDAEARKDATATAEAAAQKPTPEAKVEACKILPDCSQARIVEIPINGKLTEYVDLGDQKPGTPIRSPVKGQVAKSPESDPFVGLYVRVRDLNDPTLTSFAFSGDLEVDNMLSENVEEGQIIARVGKSGVKNFGKYKVLLRASQKDPKTGGFITAVDKLKELFQNLFSRPQDRLSYNGPVGSVITDTFLDKSPKEK